VGRPKKTWRRHATWRKGTRRRARYLCRIRAAQLVEANSGILMNLLGEVVVDLYEEIFLISKRREQEQWVFIEYAMRLDLAVKQGGDEWNCLRGVEVDVLEVALVASNVWMALNNRNNRDYTDLEAIQRELRRDARRISVGIASRTRRNAHAFRYFIK
jgi:hypothetical protein